MASRGRQYSCDSAEHTMEWMAAIADFLRPFRPLLDAHVTNFFKDRLWETVDEQWMECLRKGPVEDLIGIPYGLLREHWPASLQVFVRTLRSLVFPREPNLLHTIFCDLQVTELGTVLSQGMNPKKKHEVEILSAVISTIANVVGADTVIDIGSGQGYLAQVLCFQYHLSVVALDASSHHATVTSSRAERIKKHFTAKWRKSQNDSQGMRVPKTVTCEILSSDTLTAVIEHMSGSSLHSDQYAGRTLVLAGLHACGDLSVNMLRTFTECEKVKALVCIGCCYNLLSEEHSEKSNLCGFPMSNGAKLLGLVLGRNARDLGCQGEEKWRSLTKDAALQNFELHAFRAAFQLILDKYCFRELASVPSIGRQGKALRRRQLQRAANSGLSAGKHNSEFSVYDREALLLTLESTEVEGMNGQCEDMTTGDYSCTTSVSKDICCGTKIEEPSRKSNKFTLFEEFSKSGLNRLGIGKIEDIDFLGIWKGAQHFIDLIGPYWSLRAALGPLVEAYLLLDRLLFLQEQGCNMEVEMFPLFNPALSPRNMAIIAWKG